jgi:CheY-like chemotaxis protein
LTLKLTGLTLEKHGHQVKMASNGEIALEIMKSNQFDAVLLDLNMPVILNFINSIVLILLFLLQVLDGFETVRQFRQQELQNDALLPHNFPSDVSSISEEDTEQVLFKEEVSKTSTKIEGGIGVKTVQDDHVNNVTVEKQNENFAALHSDQLPDSNAHLLSLTPAHYHQLIIGMSSNTDDATKQRALDAGMDYFMPKPFTLEKFIDTIKATSVLGSKLNLMHQPSTVSLSSTVSQTL